MANSTPSDAAGAAITEVPSGLEWVQFSIVPTAGALAGSITLTGSASTTGQDNFQPLYDNDGSTPLVIPMAGIAHAVSRLLRGNWNQIKAQSDNAADQFNLTVTRG